MLKFSTSLNICPVSFILYDIDLCKGRYNPAEISQLNTRIFYRNFPGCFNLDLPSNHYR